MSTPENAAELDRLIELARNHRMSAVEIEAQIHSFARGNVALSRLAPPAEVETEAPPTPPVDAPRRMKANPIHYLHASEHAEFKGGHCLRYACQPVAAPLPPQAHPTVDGAGRDILRYLVEIVPHRDEAHIHKRFSTGSLEIRCGDDLSIGPAMSVRELTADEIRRLEGR